MPRILIHPSMLASQSDFYRSRCTITTYSAENRDTYGQPIPTWATLANHANLPCAFAPNSAIEAKRPDMTMAVNARIMSIAGYYPGITPKMRATVSGAVYDILSVEPDSHSKTTRLIVEVVVPSGI